MNIRPLLILLLLLPVFGDLFADDGQPQIGAKISGLRFKDIRALERTMQDFGKKKAYVLVFTTTQCPLVQKTIPKLVDLDARFGPQEVQVVAVNVGPEDSIRDVAAQAIDLNAAFPFVKDIDSSCVKALGIQRTPEVAVLNAEFKLVYRGRVDDQLRLGGTRPEPTRKDLEEALQELLSDRPISIAETLVDGCLITTADSQSSMPLPTFYKDVAPILNHRCVSCHRPGTAAPFSLLSFADARAQAEMIAEVVIDERMPPWYAHPKHGKFQNDPSLSRSERETVVNWVRKGRLEGNPSDAPSSPTFPETKWRIGEPDLVITMAEQHSIQATGYLPYRYVVLPHLFLHDTWLEAVEIRPDNPAVVHHCNLAYATPNGASEQTFITGYVPGGQPLDLGRFDNGVAYRVPRYSAFGLQIHYTTTGKPETNRLSVGIRFPRRQVQKQMRHFLLDPRPLQIPPGDGAFQVRSARTLDRDVTLLGLFTHMHVRGKDMTFFADVPGQPRETLLQIPNYNFEWQLGYELTPGAKRFPKETRIEAVAHFDNSVFNPYNPDPKRTVPYGQQTYDEMFNGFVFFVADDEQLNLTVDPANGRVVDGS